MEPTGVNPEMVEAACSTEYEMPEILMVAARAGPVFDYTWNTTAPLPAPLLDVVIQNAVLCAVQAQLEGAATVKDPLPPPDPKACPPFPSDVTQETTVVPPWLIVRPMPPMEITALCAGPLLGATTTRIVVGPVPDVAPEIVIQFGSPLTVQEQPELVRMPMGNVPPADVGASMFGDKVNVQVEEVPAWLIYTVDPPMLIVAFCAAPELGATTRVTVAGPVPEEAP